MTQVKTIFWDFGDVLVFYDHMKGCKALAQFSALSAEEIYRLVFGSKLEELSYNRGVFTDAQWYERCCSMLELKDCSYEAFAEAWGDIFTPNPKIDAVLRRVRPGTAMYVLSNTNGLHWGWAQKNLSVLAMHFPDVNRWVLSSEEKTRKPESLIYTRALKRAGIGAHEAVFIDDKPVNVEAFKSLGGNGIVYSAHMSSTKDLERELESLGCLA